MMRNAAYAYAYCSFTRFYFTGKAPFGCRAGALGGR